VQPNNSACHRLLHATRASARRARLQGEMSCAVRLREFRMTWSADETWRIKCKQMRACIFARNYLTNLTSLTFLSFLDSFWAGPLCGRPCNSTLWELGFQGIPRESKGIPRDSKGNTATLRWGLRWYRVLPALPEMWGDAPPKADIWKCEQCEHENSTKMH